MYPIDVEYLVRKGTLGSRAGDPTLLDRPSRFTRLRRALTRSQPAQAADPQARSGRPVCSVR